MEFRDREREREKEGNLGVAHARGNRVVCNYDLKLWTGRRVGRDRPRANTSFKWIGCVRSI